MAGGRAGAVHVGRFAGGIGGQRTAPLGHHAEAAKDEHFGFHLGLGIDRGDFGHRQDTRQNHALHAEFAAIEIDHIGIGGSGLHRQVAAQTGMVLGGISQQAQISEDHRIGPGAFGVGDGAVPQLFLARAGKSVDRHQQF